MLNGKPFGIEFSTGNNIKGKAIPKGSFSSQQVREIYIKEYMEIHKRRQKKTVTFSISSVFSVFLAIIIVSTVLSLIPQTYEIYTAKASGESWLSGYTYRRTVTIDNTKVTTTTDQFVVLASNTLASLKTTGNGGNVENASGYDIVWTDSDGNTVLDFEVEKYDATTGEIVHWIETDVSSTTNKTLYMYYGNDSISTDQSDKNGTWASDYVGVWHLPNNDTASTTDSTSNANNGTAYGNASSTATGQLDGAFEFDGVDDYVTTSATVSSSGNWTISWWANKPSNWVHNAIVMDWGGGNDGKIYEQSGNYYRMGASAINTVALNINQWYHVVFTYDGTDVTIFTDGVRGESGAFSPSTGSLQISDDSSDFNGTLDEVRISNTARSAQFIATEYNNQSAVSEFMTFDTEEALFTMPNTQFEIL